MISSLPPNSPSPPPLLLRHSLLLLQRTTSIHLATPLDFIQSNLLPDGPVFPVQISVRLNTKPYTIYARLPPPYRARKFFMHKLDFRRHKHQCNLLVVSSDVIKCFRLRKETKKKGRKERRGQKNNTKAQRKEKNSGATSRMSIIFLASLQRTVAAYCSSFVCVT